MIQQLFGSMRQNDVFWIELSNLDRKSLKDEELTETMWFSVEWEETGKAVPLSKKRVERERERVAGGRVLGRW